MNIHDVIVFLKDVREEMTMDAFAIAIKEAFSSEEIHLLLERIETTYA